MNESQHPTPAAPGSGVFEAALQQALDELRGQLLGDVASQVAGGKSQGGARRRWRYMVRLLVAAHKAASVSRTRTAA